MIPIAALILCGAMNEIAAADVTITIRGFNLPNELNKSERIKLFENLGVVVAKELFDGRNQVIFGQRFNGAAISFNLPGINPGDALSFAFARNSPEDPRVVATTQVLTGIVVTGPTLELDVVIPKPKPTEDESKKHCPPCRPRHRCILGRLLGR